MIRYSVVTPTFKRPQGVLRAVRSVFAQTVGRTDVEMVCVDNDPQGSARDALASLAGESPIPLRTAHAPDPGVSNARNAAMALVRGTHVVFLDDDQEAEPGWLEALARCQESTKADAVFGLTNARLENPDHPHADYIASLYQRIGPAQSGPINHYYGMNNSLLLRATMLAAPAPFDPRANESGGEDDLLFADGLARGRRYAWCVDARAVEWVEPRRSKITYALKRALAYGQGPCETAWSARPRDYVGLARHMSVGAAQAILYGAAAAGAFAIGSGNRMHLLDRSVRGVGKLVWWKTQNFYGAAHRP